MRTSLPHCPPDNTCLVSRMLASEAGLTVVTRWSRQCWMDILMTGSTPFTRRTLMARCRRSDQTSSHVRRPTIAERRSSSMNRTAGTRVPPLPQRSVPSLKRERARDAKRPKLRLNPTHTNMTVTYQTRYTDNTLHIV